MDRNFSVQHIVNYIWSSCVKVSITEKSRHSEGNYVNTKGASLYDWDSGMINVKVEREKPFEFEDQYVQAKNVNIKFFLDHPMNARVTAVAQWLRCCATNRKVADSIPASVSGFFIDIKFFRSHYGPGVVSASNRNEYQEHFLGVKVAGA